LETIAVYWEPKIKVYGFQELTDLSLLELDFKPDRMPEWGLVLGDLDDVGSRFELVLMQYVKGQSVRLYILLKREWEDRVTEILHRKIRKGSEGTVSITSPAELIFFYGPHFGDRYGIGDAAFKVLTRETIPIIAAACSGSAVYIVLPENMANKVRILLAEAFEVPNHAPHE
jgi:aspartokinase